MTKYLKPFYPVWQEMTGKQFNEINKQRIKFYKLTFQNENHRGFQYKTGLNIDTNKFIPMPWDTGLYFTEESLIIHWKDLYIQRNEQFSYKRHVIIPDDARVYGCYDKIKVDKFILEDKEEL
ncbi:hypothetical protein Klosneuvirus_3_281 [Klosneuvirus KNV1]|uniref:Uncharacterized protein n=1 Tax=Klosneuvirus KNV1 TaxID=1977640 RepID=A0A1V0SKA3_9VIRU|nr:hypothetical protein Klosneuvirus_3_281 [Klosneuvirus KNV1]